MKSTCSNSYRRRASRAHFGKRQQKGIALLTILLTISMMVILMNEITQSFRNQVQRTQLQQDGNQAKWYAMSAESLAIFSLTETLKDDPKTMNLS